jgi:hypothetical protein
MVPDFALIADAEISLFSYVSATQKNLLKK